MLNVAYALLAERADAADHVAVPTLIAAGAEPEEVEAGMRRRALDEWLEGSTTEPVVTKMRDFLYGGVAS